MAQTQVYVGSNSEQQCIAATDALTHMILTATKKANTEAKREARSLSVALPIGMLQANDAPGNYRELLRSVLRSTAEAALNAWADQYTSLLPTHCNEELFTVEALSAGYLAKNASEWIGKDELEVLWNTSATWARIVGSKNYAENKAYAAAATELKNLVLKMSGKVTMIAPEKLDKIVAKLEDADLNTRLGTFILKRAEAMKAKHAQDNVDQLDALDF